MSRVLTTDALIKSVRRRAMIPDDSSAFTDEAIIDIMNEELDEQVISKVLVTNEEHLVDSIKVTVDKDKSEYKIPYRAVGNKLRDLAYVDSSDGHYELSRISLEELSDYRNSYTSYNRDVFYVKGDSVNLLDVRILDYEALIMYYYLRPNVLVKEEDCGVITSINTTTGEVALNRFPSSFFNIPKMDFVGKKTPNSIKSYDITPTSINSSAKTVTFKVEELPEDLEVGDYLCKAEESPVPNIPTEFHPILAQATAVHILESLGDSEGLANANRKLENMIDQVVQITNDRVEGAPQKINPRHTTLAQTSRHGLTRRRRRL